MSPLALVFCVKGWIGEMIFPVWKEVGVDGLLYTAYPGKIDAF